MNPMSPIDLEKELARLHKDSFGWALRCCKEDKWAAEEVLQTTYLKILEGKARYKGASSFKTWLFAVIRNTALDHLNKSRRQQLVIPTVEQEPIDPAETKSGFSTTNFLKSLHSLSPKQQQILHLVFYQNCSIEEAAAVMEMPIGTARTHYSRGKEQLKKRLLQNGIFNPTTNRNSKTN